MQLFAAATSKHLSKIMGLLVDESEKVQESYSNAESGKFQPIGDVTTLEARRFGAKYQIGFPIQAWGDRFLYSQSFLDEATLADLNSHVVNTALTDARTFISEILKGVMYKDNYDFDDNQWPGQRLGTIKVKRLFNADGADEGYIDVPDDNATYQISTLNHYLPSGSNTLDANAFALVRDTLRKLGNDDDIIVLTSKADADAAEGVTGFIPYAVTNDPKIVAPNTFTRALVSSPRARGRINHCEVWEMPHMSAGYLFGFDRTKRKPGRVRNSHLAKYHGLNLVVDETRGGSIPGNPIVGRTWRRIFGAAVQNRGNGVAVQITNAGTYTNPTL